jgi:hypothetical protein
MDCYQILIRMAHIERQVACLRANTDDMLWKTHPCAIEYRALMCDWWTHSNAEAYEAIGCFQANHVGDCRRPLIDVTNRGLTYACSTNLEHNRQTKFRFHVTKADRQYVAERKAVIAVARRLSGKDTNK